MESSNKKASRSKAGKGFSVILGIVSTVVAVSVAVEQFQEYSAEKSITDLLLFFGLIALAAGSVFKLVKDVSSLDDEPDFPSKDKED